MMEWIGLKDKLPPHDTSVLVTDGVQITVGSLWQDGFGVDWYPVCVNVYDADLAITPTHWMPLDFLPKVL